MNYINAFLIIVATCCFAGCTTPTKNELFTTVPPHVTESDAIRAVSVAATKRNWQVRQIEADQIELELNHRGYHALLSFTVKENEIRYTDIGSSFTPDPIRLLNGGSMPASWMKNLKKDVNDIFYISPQEQNSIPTTADPIVEKLNSLKSLRDQGVITEAEYKQKRKEILSEY
ncbi:hypothetical protein PDESU_04276 [Pontiella desulfatans]|uniref:SHOCT domain-containing protein n=1 Tax=Pontiella desulfatans TaxID=2750659 RepID=A0A6C2U849_PONDE|nr:SHOCT domain-containing protein [Pontiella desulfatans]VGO15691.1 hypothetical protein PDESU_04276 [Pontiella desulfatans]